MLIGLSPRNDICFDEHVIQKVISNDNLCTCWTHMISKLFCLKQKWYYLLPPVQLLSDSFTYVFDLISNGIIKGPTMNRTLVVDIHGKGVMSPHV